MRKAAGVAAMLVLACTVGQKKQLVEKATDDAGRRREMFEATLRLLDEKPEYVDEFFQLARKHDRTLNRFTADFSRGLADPALARMVARHLVQAPPGLHQVLVATIDAAEGPQAKRAMTSAMQARSEKVAAIMATDPGAAAEVGKAFARRQGRALGEALRGALAPRHRGDGGGDGGGGDGGGGDGGGGGGGGGGGDGHGGDGGGGGADEGTGSGRGR
jgi:hypothetical protein